MTSKFKISQDGYLFGSRIATHISFWVVYYVAFSLIWANNAQYYESFGLEFVLLPVRVCAAYVSLYLLIPQYLVREREFHFALLYVALLIVAGILQRVFTYFYYELLILKETAGLFSPGSIIKSIVLINSTVMFLSALKIYQLWKKERLVRKENSQELLEIRADKRNHRIKSEEIAYVEGLGNYVIFYLANEQKLISYITLKDAEKLLPGTFVRSHKSFIINKGKVQSYTTDSVEINGRIIPIGKSVRLEF